MPDSVGYSHGIKEQPYDGRWSGHSTTTLSLYGASVCHLEDDSKASTQAVHENASVVRTLFDLFSSFSFISSFVEVKTFTLLTLPPPSFSSTDPPSPPPFIGC